MILVGNRREGCAGEYVGRPSPLGNPYTVEKIGRDAACDLYARWFTDNLAAGPSAQPRFFLELTRLQEIARRGDLTLVCWCAPKRCHAETIKAWLEANP